MFINERKYGRLIKFQENNYPLFEFLFLFIYLVFCLWFYELSRIASQLKRSKKKVTKDIFNVIGKLRHYARQTKVCKTEQMKRRFFFKIPRKKKKKKQRCGQITVQNAPFAIEEKEL